MSWRKCTLPLACIFVLLSLIQLVEPCTVGSNFNFEYCGDCNLNCHNVPHTIDSCTNGLCDCAAGWANCDQDNTNGCETPIPSNLVGFRCYGTGRNGKLDVQFGGRSLGLYRTSVSGSQGSNLLSYASFPSIYPGDLVIIHQTQTYNAIGTWEYNRVKDVNGGSNIFILEANLLHNYGPRAQIVAVAEFTDALVANSFLVAPGWDGSVGGILPFLVQGTLTVSNVISMDGRGFRGQVQPYCPQQCIDGLPGEGHTGIFGAPTRSNIGSGGGGGAHGRDCGHGASGGYGTAGGSVGSPTDACADTSLGAAIGGSAIGSTNLRSVIHLGGAGGEGGGDEDGAYPGYGGDGGGIIIINAKTIALFSEITADGTDGGPGVQNTFCGGSGCGMAGGGGGAGGGIRLVTTSMSGGGAVTAVGGIGGTCTCGGRGPTGGFGRTEAGPGAVSLGGGISPGAFAPS